MSRLVAFAGYACWKCGSWGHYAADCPSLASRDDLERRWALVFPSTTNPYGPQTKESVEGAGAAVDGARTREATSPTDSGPTSEGEESDA